MATGTVKWFNDAKGFGFITQDGGGEDVFCHHSAINMDGFRTLAEGQKVEFEVTRGPKGLQAQNVRAAAYRARQPLLPDWQMKQRPGPLSRDRASCFPAVAPEQAARAT